METLWDKLNYKNKEKIRKTKSYHIKSLKTGLEVKLRNEHYASSLTISDAMDIYYAIYGGLVKFDLKRFFDLFEN